MEPEQHMHPGGNAEQPSAIMTPGASTSWQYNLLIKVEKDIKCIRAPRYLYDMAETQRMLQHMHDLLGDILPVHLTYGVGYHLDVLY